MVHVQRRSTSVVRREDPRPQIKKPTVAPVRKPEADRDVSPVRKPTVESEKTALLTAQNDTRALQLRSQLDRKLDKPTPDRGAAGTPPGPTTTTSTALTPRPYQVPDVADFHPQTDESERTTAVAQQQEKSVQDALSTGQPTAFTNSEGKTVQVTAQKTDAGYTYTMDGKKADVTFDDSYDEAARTRSLAKLMDYHSQTPAVADGAVQTFKFQKEDPTTNTMASYSRSDRSITFLGENRLTESNFDHEMGHGVGYQLSGSTSSTPPGWEDVVSKDGNELSGYGKQSNDQEKDSWHGWLREKLGGKDWADYRSDDFAESYQAYKEAQESGPQAMQQFRQKFPNRAAYLDQHFPGERSDSPMPQDESLPRVA